MTYGGPQEQVVVKSAAELDPAANQAASLAASSAIKGQHTVAAQRPWYEQERLCQHDEPAGGASTSVGLHTKPRDRVKFADSSSSSCGAKAGQEPLTVSLPQQLLSSDEGGSTPVAVITRTGFFSFSRGKQNAADEGAASHSQQPDEASGTGSKHWLGSLSRGSSHTGQAHHVGFDSSAAGGAGSRSQAASEAASRAQSEAPSRSQSVAASGMSATLKGLFGGASSKLLGGIMGRGSASSKSEEAAEAQEELWFTSLDDFKPICHMLHRGRYMTAYFACANKTGQHFLLKKYDKHKMLPAEERGVRRAIAFSELLQHASLVRMMGTWESDDIIFVVEEYVGKGDILNDCISHPDKYTERHVAVALAKPLLQALAHLHANNIIHRSVLPENAYMGLDDVLRLGHLVLAIDQTSDRPKSRTTLLDYMSPEMLSIRPLGSELALLDDDSEEGGSSLSGSGSFSRADSQYSQYSQQQQQWAGLEPDEQLPRAQLGLLGCEGPVSPTAAAIKAHDAANLLLEEAAEQAAGLQHHSHQSEQQRRGKWMQQPAQLDPSRQASLDPEAIEQLQEAAADPVLDAAASATAAATAAAAGAAGQKRAPRHSKALLSPCGGRGRADWEYQDHYNEKVDIWQLGCMLHELLCGSMPFELDSKMESAGLSLWADVEVLPGNVPPDCADFIKQTLTKNPRLRPSAQQLLQHPWLARCQAGEPWRDPIELEAARREAELATVSGWIRYHWAAAASAVSAAMLHWQRGGRVGPAHVPEGIDHQQQQQHTQQQSQQQQRGVQ